MTAGPGVRHNRGMPRANRRRRDDAPLNHGRALGGVERREQHAGGEWFVRAVTGAAATRAYLCPGCSQDVRPGGSLEGELTGTRARCEHERVPVNDTPAAGGRRPTLAVD